MNGFNKWIGIGNVASNPHRREGANGGSYVSFLMEVTDRWKHEGQSYEATSFVPIVSIASLADSVQQHLRKGREILVEGKLHIISELDQSQRRQLRASIRAERIEFLGQTERPVPAPDHQERGNQKR